MNAVLPVLTWVLIGSAVIYGLSRLYNHADNPRPPLQHEPYNQQEAELRRTAQNAQIAHTHRLIYAQWLVTHPGWEWDQVRRATGDTESGQQ